MDHAGISVSLCPAWRKRGLEIQQRPQLANSRTASSTGRHSCEHTEENGPGICQGLDLRGQVAGDA